MQKLEKRNRCTPIGAPQADGNCEVGQVRQDLKTFSNNSDVDKLREEKWDLRGSIYILNMKGQPLMPTIPKKARLLLKKKKAKVIYRMRFTECDSM